MCMNEHSPSTRTKTSVDLCSAQKGGFIGPAAKEGIALLFPDTSPRGAGIEGEDADWQFGTGACYCRLYWSLELMSPTLSTLLKVPDSTWMLRIQNGPSTTTC